MHFYILRPEYVMYLGSVPGVGPHIHPFTVHSAGKYTILMQTRLYIIIQFMSYYHYM
jgi:hypothetical protein